MSSYKQYLVAGSRPWNRRIFNHYFADRKNWHFVDNPGALTRKLLESLQPRYVFFWHWSWIVPAEIHERYECVCFHMTDLPFGRGGSPLQNLIIRGREETRLTALRMTEELDAGDVYCQDSLPLEGKAQAIYERATEMCAVMSARIAEDEPSPNPQVGDVVTFARRLPEQSMLPSAGSLKNIYDFIRMLDAEGYPHAFIEHGEYILKFTDAVSDNGGLCAKVHIQRKGESR